MMIPRFTRLFIVTYGRSGSTLLQGLVNALPGYRIQGENGGFLSGLQSAHAALTDAHDHLADPARDTPINPWFGASRYEPGFLITEFRAFAERMLFGPSLDEEAGPELPSSDRRVLGFKEIRYSDLEPDRLEELLAFLHALWPGAALIFNSRALSDVVTSGWWRNQPPESVRARLTRFDTFAAAYVAENPAHAIHLSYDRLVETDRREVGRLMDFLGEAPAARDLEIVFARNHSWANKALTEYLRGRAGHVRLFEHDWWRAHVDDFRIEVLQRSRAWLARGVFLPSAGSAPRLFLRTSCGDVEVVTGEPTPRLAKLFPGNPAGAAAGFRVELAGAEDVHLIARVEGGRERQVGRLKVGE